MNFNRIILLGNLTRDPETRTLPSGQAVTNFGLATNRIYTDQNGAKQQAVEFHNIVAFGKIADICSRYLKKGDLAMVEGRIQTRSWLDQNGVKKYKTETVVENMQLGPKRNAPGATDDSVNANQTTEQIPTINAEEMYGTPLNEEEGEINTKNIPF